jgi:glycosyltransferase involved in cell wall biosynthesis
MVCDAVTDYLGGCMLLTRRFAEHLVSRGHKVIFITSKSPKSQCNGHWGSIGVYRFRSFPSPFFEGAFYLGLPSKRELIKIFRDNGIDIAHILLPMPSGLSALAAARALHIPVVMHSEMQPENVVLNLPKFVPVGWLNRLFYRYAHWFYAQADAVIFPTAFSHRLFHALDGCCKTEVISNGVNLDIFRKVDSDRFLERLNLPRGTRNLMFVGRLHPEKDVATLIRAVPTILRRHPQTHLFIVGHGHQEPQLKSLAQRLGIAKHVTFFGPLTGEDLTLAFNACDIFVLPSLAECEGMVVLEAMACAKPLLIANSSGSASVHLLDGNGLLFEPQNSEDLAEQACKLLSDPGLLSAMSERSLANCQRYDIKMSVSALENVYYSLRGSRPAVVAIESNSQSTSDVATGTRSSAAGAMKVYEGKRSIDGLIVTVDGQPLSQHWEVKCFTRSGFDWTYEGPHPRQLAFAILYDHLKDKDRAISLSKIFMKDIVANFDNDWMLSSQDVDAEIRRIEACPGN